MVATLVARNADEAVSGVWRSLHLLGLWSQAAGVFWCVWLESTFIRRKDIFTLNLLYKQFYKFYTCSDIWEDIVAINCITVQYKNGSFPPISMSNATLVWILITG